MARLAAMQITRSTVDTIKGPADYPAPRPEDFARQELAHEPEALKISGGLPALRPEQLKRGLG